MTPNKLSRRLLEVIGANGGWMSRRDIAQAINRPVLNPSQIAEVERLAFFGYLERRETEIGLVRTKAEYKRTEKAL